MGTVGTVTVAATTRRDGRNVAPVTGDLGSLGAPIRDAAILPGSQLEDEGVAYEIDIREEDTETDPQAGISGAQALADAGYPSVTGAASSAVTIAVAEDIFFPNEVVGISPASTSPDITDMDGDYLLRTAPSDAWRRGDGRDRLREVRRRCRRSS